MTSQSASIYAMLLRGETSVSTHCTGHQPVEMLGDTCRTTKIHFKMWTCRWMTDLRKKIKIPLRFMLGSLWVNNKELEHCQSHGRCSFWMLTTYMYLKMMLCSSFIIQDCHLSWGHMNMNIQPQENIAAFQNERQRKRNSSRCSLTSSADVPHSG